MSNVAKEHAERYVVSGAIIQCSDSTAEGSLQLHNSHKLTISGKHALNIRDNQSMANIGSMGQCKRQDKCPHCVPSISMLWQEGAESVRLDNTPALLNTSYIICMHGGVIKIVDDGQ